MNRLPTMTVYDADGKSIIINVSDLERFKSLGYNEAPRPIEKAEETEKPDETKKAGRRKKTGDE